VKRREMRRRRRRRRAAWGGRVLVRHRIHFPQGFVGAKCVEAAENGAKVSHFPIALVNVYTPVGVYTFKKKLA